MLGCVAVVLTCEAAGMVLIFFVCILAFELTGTSLRNSKCLRVDMLISLNGVNELSARA